MVSISKIASVILMPLPCALLLLLLGLLFLLLTKRQGFGKVLITLSFLILFTFSLSPVSYLLLHPLEAQYPPYQDSSQVPDYIITLGNSDIPDNNLPYLAQLSDTARSRLTETLRLHHMYPNATLIFSGGHRQPSRPSNAFIMAQAAISLGVSKAQIQLFEYNMNTHDEAVSIAPVIRGKTALLVTSASHMPRAIALFRTVGAFPTPAPTDIQAKKASTKNTKNTNEALTYIPNANALAQSHQALHEWLGRLWALITGQIQTEQS